MTLPPPRALVTRDTVVDARRRLTLAIDPGLDAESVGFGVTAPARITGRS